MTHHLFMLTLSKFHRGSIRVNSQYFSKCIVDMQRQRASCSMCHADHPSVSSAASRAARKQTRSMHGAPHVSKSGCQFVHMAVLSHLVDVRASVALVSLQNSPIESLTCMCLRL